MVTASPPEMKPKKTGFEKFLDFSLRIFALIFLFNIGTIGYKYAIDFYNDYTAVPAPTKPQPQRPSKPVPTGIPKRTPEYPEPMGSILEIKKSSCVPEFKIPINPTVEDFLKHFGIFEKITDDKNNNLNRIDCFFERGIDPNFPDSRGDSPVSLAVTHRMLPVIKRMHKVAKIDFKRMNKTGSTVMHLSVAVIPKNKEEIQKMKDVITYLVSIGGQVDVMTKNGWTPLMIAIKDGNEKAVRILLNYFNADVNAPTIPFKSSPLTLAVETKNLTMLKLLIKHKANVYQVNEDQATAFHLAAANGFVEGLEHIIVEVPKFDYNLINPLGNTALHYAVWNDQIESVKYLLLACRPDFHIKNNEGLTAYHFAAKKEEILEYFLNVNERRSEYNKEAYERRTSHLSEAEKAENAFQAKKREYEKELESLEMEYKSNVRHLNQGNISQKQFDEFMDMFRKTRKESEDFVADYELKKKKKDADEDDDI